MKVCLSGIPAPICPPVAVRLSVILVVSAAPVDGHPAPAVAAAVARVAGGVHAEDGGGAVLPPGGRLATH